MQLDYGIVGRRVERTWGVPFWVGTIVSVVAAAWFVQSVMFDSVTAGSLLGSVLVAAAPGILVGVVVQMLWFVVTRTRSGAFGLMQYALIGAAMLVAVAVGLLYSRLPEGLQEALPLVAEAIVWICVLVVFIVTKHAERSAQSALHNTTFERTPEGRRSR